MTSPDNQIPHIPIGEGINYPDPDMTSPRFHSDTRVRRQVSIGSSRKVGIQTSDENGVPKDVDEVVLRAFDGDKLLVTYENVAHPSTGVYEVVIGPPATSQRRVVTLMWSYTSGEHTLEFSDEIVVMDRMPTYDSLSDQEKTIIEQVSWMFDDLFDSTEGGAFLAENFQSHFNYERLAQLTTRALQKINIFAQPITNYVFGGGGGGSRVPAKYHAVLVSAAYLEVLRHLIRSYVEIPEFRNMSTTYTDRRDYMQRWRVILDEEKEAVDNAITLMKRDHLNLGGGALLVSGGYFGGGGRGSYFSGSTNVASARGWRMYPTAPLARY